MHTLPYLHASDRRREDLGSGSTFVLESRDGSDVQIREAA